MINRTCTILSSLLLPFSSFANTITISAASSSPSGWTYTAGVITASANVTINNAAVSSYLVAGNLTIEAGTNIVIDGNINPALGAGIIRTLTLRAGGNIAVEASRTISCSTGGLNMVLWSDTDNSNGGFIFCKSASILNSKGAHIWMGGGDGTATWNGLTVGDGFAKGSSVTTITIAELNSGANASGFRNGITFYNNSVVSGGGHIAINGQSAALSNAYGYMGLYMGYNATVSSGAGNITIDARSDGASSATATGWFYGILMIPTNNINNAYGTASIESTSGNITISATARHNQNISHNAGMAMFTQHATATARVLTHSGDITITGSNLNLSNPSYGGIFLTGGGSEQIVSRTGNITLQGNSSNSSVAGINANSASQIGYDGSNDYNGTIQLIADNISFSNTAAALQSSGQLRISPVTTSRTISIGATGGLALPAGFFANNCVNGFSSVRLGNSSYTGNITIGTITFQDNVILETTGIVTQTGAITASAQDMSFLGVNATYTLTNGANNVRSVAASTGTIQYTNSTALELGSITASGTVQVATLAGDLTITGNIDAANTGTAAIRLYADYNKLESDATGGNIIITGSPLITTGAGGRASLYAGSPAGSTGLVSLVGGTANVRMNADANTATFTPPLGAGVFALFRADASTLPVSLVEFNLKCMDGKSVLYWTTATETGNRGFYIEKRIDQLPWKSLGFVAGAGDSYASRHYRFEDDGQAVPLAAYRLKQVDRNEKFTYSKIVSAQCHAADNSLLAVQGFPNPTSSLLELQGLTGNDLVRFTVYNPQGIPVKTGTITAANGIINLVGHGAGLYLVKLDFKNVTKMIRVIKQ